MPRAKAFIDTDVLTEAKKRIHHIFDLFDRVVVMFSGGKDSLVVLHLVKEVMEERFTASADAGQVCTRPPVDVVFRDEELIPDEVIDFVNKYRQEPWIRMLWFAVPLASTKYVMGVCHSYTQWDAARVKAGNLVRPIPPWAITLPAGDTRVMDQYTMDAFTAGYYGTGKIAFLTGIRAAESLIRFRACVNKLNENYINAVVDPAARNVNLCKPIFDWSEDDVFRYFYDRGIRYCSLYDLQMWAGGAMRVSTPLHAESAKQFDRILSICGCPAGERVRQDLSKTMQGAPLMALDMEAEAVAAERERCAVLCDQLGDAEYVRLCAKGNVGIARLAQKHYIACAKAIRENVT